MKQALIIIDVQNDYFPEGKFPLINTESALTNTLHLQHNFRIKKLPIFYIQHLKQGSNADFFVKNSVGAEFHPKLLPIIEENELIIQKSYPNSFYQTDLQQKLQQHSVKQLVICGMMSHMCVDSTTRRANELGYQPILIHDACTTRDLDFDDETIPAKKVHNSFMSALAGFAKVINCHEFIQKKID